MDDEPTIQDVLNVLDEHKKLLENHIPSQIKEANTRLDDLGVAVGTALGDLRDIKDHLGLGPENPPP